MSLANLFRLTQSYPAGYVMPLSWPPVGIRDDNNNPADRPSYQLPKNLQTHFLSLFDGDFQFSLEERFSNLELDGIISYRFNETMLCAMLRYPDDPFVVQAAEYLYNFTIDFSPRHNDLPPSCQVNSVYFVIYHLYYSRTGTINCAVPKFRTSEFAEKFHVC